MIYTISEMFDLEHTIAAKLFEGKTYPWEVLDHIKDFILELGPTLPADEFDHPAEGVWIAKDAKAFDSAYIGSPASSTTKPRCGSAPSCAAPPSWAKTPWWAIPRS